MLGPGSIPLAEDLVALSALKKQNERILAQLTQRYNARTFFWFLILRGMDGWGSFSNFCSQDLFPETGNEAEDI